MTTKYKCIYAKLQQLFFGSSIILVYNVRSVMVNYVNFDGWGQLNIKIFTALF